MTGLLQLLKQDRDDPTIIKAAIETLAILCDDSKNNSEDPKEAQLGQMFSEIYIKQVSNVTMLLEILQDDDFYIRFNSIQLLNALLTNTGSHIHDCILTSPMGLSRLIDLLDDKREIIRNGIKTI